MATLNITLGDGFADDTVAISLDGRQVYAKDHVKTDLRISRADGLETEAPEGGATLEVRARGQSASAEVDPARDAYVSIDLDPQGRPQIRRSDEPFPML
ncbi:MAG: hypothetical protein ACOY5Y_01560 [Pseudomonadota bacterium]|jgi:hypothetical protein